MRRETLDFIQINYSLEDRGAEQRILPLAAERGMAVLINLPLGGGRLMKAVKAKPLPDCAKPLGCASWSEVLLKFVLSHPAVTCAIPGTGNPAHMAQNCRAGEGPLPDAGIREALIAVWGRL